MSLFWYLPPPELTFSEAFVTDQDISSAGALVQDRFNLSASYANEAWGLVSEILANLSGNLSSVETALLDGSSQVPTSFVDFQGTTTGNLPNILAPSPLTRPATYVPKFTAVDFPPVMEVMQTMGIVEVDIDSLVIPDFTGELIKPDFGDYPTTAMPSVPSDPPVLVTPDLPPTPTYTMPSLAELEDVVIPAPPEVMLPAFDGIAPNIALVEPNVAFNFDEVPYDSELAAKVTAWLDAQIDSGGTGLSAEVEAAIFARATDRMTEKNLAKYDEATRYWAARGHTLPPGALSAKIDEVINEIDREESGLSMDITIEQARLAQTNTHFVITNAIGFEQVLMDHANKVQQRAFEGAKYAVEAALAVYNAKIAAFQLQLEEYKSHAIVFEALVKVELAKTEMYRSQIEGVKATVEVQKLRVDAYTAQLEANKNIVDLYVAEMEGAKVKIQVEALRIEAFKSQVEAAVAAINGVAAEYNLYNAKVEGEVAKISGYKAEVDAYTSLVQAKKIEADINIAKAETTLKSNENKVAILKAAVDKYQADIGYETAEEAANVKSYEAEVKLYEADITNNTSWRKDSVAIYDAQTKAFAAEVDAQLKNARNSIDYALGSYQVSSGLSETAAKVSGTLAAAALTSVSANSSYSHGSQVSQSRAQSEQKSSISSTSHSYQQSTSESSTSADNNIVQHIYNHKA